MDGFEKNIGVIIRTARSSPEILDPDLMIKAVLFQILAGRQEKLYSPLVINGWAPWLGSSTE